MDCVLRDEVDIECGKERLKLVVMEDREFFMIADNGEDRRLMTIEMNASVLFVNHQKETLQRTISWN